MIKKVAQITGVTFFLFVIAASIFFVYSVAKLPSPSAFNKILKSVPVKNNNPAVVTPPSERNVASENKATAESQNSNPVPAETPDKNVKDNVNEYLTEDFKDIRVCQNLSRAKPAKDTDDFSQQFINTLTQNDREDPVQESWRAALKYVFQQPVVKTLFDDLNNYGDVQPEDRSELLSKIGFYARATKMMYQLYTQKKTIENFADHSNHLSLIAQIVSRKPELANDPHITDFCYQIQNAMAAKSPVPVAEERAEVLKLISYAGFTPEELHFDPNKYMAFKTSVDKKTFQFGFQNE